MNSNNSPSVNPDFFMISGWYETLANHTFPTSFVKLRPGEIQALAEGDLAGKAAQAVIERLRAPLKSFPGNCFVSADSVAPTDTERFAGKRGAVYSAESAWKYLALSEKVRKAAAAGEVGHICIRPFRRMSKPREFRLFIYKGRLSAMSQYWLIRHYRRIEGYRKKFWDKAEHFVSEISWLLPHHTMVMDIYVTATGRIIIVDINQWGEPTSPLLLKTWDRDWSIPAGIVLINPPVTIRGEINVSF